MNFHLVIRPNRESYFLPCSETNRRTLWNSQLSCSGLKMNSSAEANSYINRTSGWSPWQREVWFTEVWSIRDDRGTDDPYKVQIRENPGAIMNPKRNWSWILFCPNSNHSLSRKHSPSTHISSFYWAWHQTRFSHSNLCYAQALWPELTCSACLIYFWLFSLGTKIFGLHYSWQRVLVVKNTIAFGRQAHQT